jgi:hypothetical protein
MPNPFHRGKYFHAINDNGGSRRVKLHPNRSLSRSGFVAPSASGNGVDIADDFKPHLR